MDLGMNAAVDGASRVCAVCGRAAALGAYPEGSATCRACLAGPARRGVCTTTAGGKGWSPTGRDFRERELMDAALASGALDGLSDDAWDRYCAAHGAGRLSK